MLRNSKVLIIAASLLMTLVIVVSILFGVGAFFSRQGLGQNFLIQLFKGNERAAFDYLSPELQRAVRLNCPNGQIVGCADRFAPSEWGDLVRIVFVRSSTRTQTELFHTEWSGLEGAVSIVLQISALDEGDTINGVWGFLRAGSDAEDDALLTGELRGRDVEVGVDTEPSSRPRKLSS
jgi:hypothetical protein